MDITVITSLISSVGFPIVACCVMAWYVKYQTDAHKEEITELKKSIDSNTSVMQKLLDKMGDM